MNKLKLMSLFSAMFFLTTAALGQDALNKRSVILNVGVGVSKPDLRYDFLIGRVGIGPVNNAQKHRYDADMELYFTAVKPIKLVGNLDATAGIGYAFLQKKPKLPVQRAYFDVLEEIFITSKIYQIHQLQVPIGLQFSAVRKENFTLGLYANALGNIAFIKHVEPVIRVEVAEHLTTIEFTPFSVESFAGLFVRIRRFSYTLDTRIFHGQFRDDALFNSRKQFDPYNLFKMRFMVGYQL